MPKTLTRTEIAARIVPQRARWSKDGLIAWTDLHQAVDILHYAIGEFEDAVCKIEHDSDLSTEGVARKRADLATRVLQELEDFTPLRKAEKTVQANIEHLSAKMTALPAKPTEVADVMLAAEIRAHLRSQPSPASAVLTQIADSRVVGAAIHAPGVLTGLKEEEVLTIKEYAKQSLHPQETALQNSLTRALADLRTGVASAARMVRERAGL